MASSAVPNNGIPLIWISGFAVVVSLSLTFGMIGLLMSKGLTLFWPSSLVAMELKDGRRLAGEIIDREEISDSSQATKQSILLKTGNRELTGEDFLWIEEADIVKMNQPRFLAVFERSENGNLYGYPARANLPSFKGILQKGAKRRAEKESIQRKLAVLGAGEGSAEIGEKITTLEEKLVALEERDLREVLKVQTLSGETVEIPPSHLFLAYQPNAMTFFDKFFFFLKKFFSFLISAPREANTEGGILPAIFGTVILVFLMTLIVVPLGILAAVYLHEYAKPLWLVNIVRLAVNNLAGVPSIVFGIFGLGFFVYMMGGTIDQLFFSNRLPEPTFGTGGLLWASLTLALLTLPVVIVATEEGLSAVPSANREGALALSATQFQTIIRVVLPHAMPGILTGVILAISRAAGEVAPLMLTGAVKLASSMPINGEWPFIHLNQKFMHLGFHIYDVGFQSPNVEAAKPMVYATAFVLLMIVLLLNGVAIYMRNHLRKRYKMSTI